MGCSAASSPFSSFFCRFCCKISSIFLFTAFCFPFSCCRRQRRLWPAWWFLVLQHGDGVQRAKASSRRAGSKKKHRHSREQKEEKIGWRPVLLLMGFRWVESLSISFIVLFPSPSLPHRSACSWPKKLLGSMALFLLCCCACSWTSAAASAAILLLHSMTCCCAELRGNRLASSCR